jgi:hypothetical protein
MQSKLFNTYLKILILNVVSICNSFGQYVFPKSLVKEDSLNLAKTFQLVENAIVADSLEQLFQDSSFCSHFKYSQLYGCIDQSIEKDLIGGLPHSTIEKMKMQIKRSPLFCNGNGVVRADSSTLNYRLSLLINERLIHDSLISNINLLYSLTMDSSQKYSYFKESQVYHTKFIDSLFYSNLYIFLPDGRVYRNVLSKYSLPEFKNITESRYIINGNKLIIEKITVNGTFVVRSFTTYKLRNKRLVYLEYSTNSPRNKPGKYTVLSLYKI